MKTLSAKKTFIFKPEKEVYIIQLEEELTFFEKIFGTAKEVSEAPKEGCRAFFSGLLISDEFLENHISLIYQVDPYSEYVGCGQYPKNTKAFPKSVKTTFDGIAIDRNTRVIIYSKKNFRGKILLDKTGPAIINNGAWRNDERINNFTTKKFKEPLETNFPPECRIWSDTNMNKWSKGSVKISCINTD